MKLFTSIEEIPATKKPVILTIGMFDGVHRGHQAVLHKVTETAKAKGTKSCVITFENNPKEILDPKSTVSSLCSYDNKIRRLKELGVDLVLSLKFTKSLAHKTAKEFLEEIFTALPFSQLILGYNATIGSDQQSNTQRVNEAGHDIGFKVHYLPPYLVGKTTVSSTLIRNLLAEGRIAESHQLLGWSD